MEKTADRFVDMKRWMEESLPFEGIEADELIRIFKGMLSARGYTIQEEKDAGTNWSVKALQGSFRVKLLSIVPYLKYFSLGKRLKLDAVITRQKTTTLKLRIVPAMEWFDEEEFFAGGQDGLERITDDAFAAKSFRSLVQSLYQWFQLPLPVSCAQFFARNLMQDVLMSWLIYPTEGYRSQRNLYSVPEGMRWCWKAFFIPEFWFIWQELWGIGMIMFSFFYFWVLLLQYQGGAASWRIAAILLAVRVVAGFIGGPIFYTKYGYFPGEPPNRPKQTFASWLKSAWPYLVLFTTAIAVAMVFARQWDWVPVFFVLPFLVVGFLILAAVILNRPDKPKADEPMQQSVMKSQGVAKRDPHNVWIPALLTVAAAAGVFLLNPSIEALWMMLLLGFPFFIILFGIFFCIGIFVDHLRQRRKK